MPDINPHIYRQVLLSKGTKTTQQREPAASSRNAVGKTGFQTQKIETIEA